MTCMNKDIKITKFIFIITIYHSQIIVDSEGVNVSHAKENKKMKNNFFKFFW